MNGRHPSLGDGPTGRTGPSADADAGQNISWLAMYGYTYIYNIRVQITHVTYICVYTYVYIYIYIYVYIYIKTAV